MLNYYHMEPHLLIGRKVENPSFSPLVWLCASYLNCSHGICEPVGSDYSHLKMLILNVIKSLSWALLPAAVLSLGFLPSTAQRRAFSLYLQAALTNPFLNISILLTLSVLLTLPMSKDILSCRLPLCNHLHSCWRFPLLAIFSVPIWHQHV